MVNLSAKSGTHSSPLALPTRCVIYYCLLAVDCFIIDERQLGKILISACASRGDLLLLINIKCEC